jgi:hypothetical protein
MTSRIKLSLASLLTLSGLFGAGAAPELPLAFEKNQGQAGQSVDFLARGSGYSVSLSHGNARLALRHDKSAAAAAVDLRLLGANRHPKAATRHALPGKVNYFLGNDPARWRTDIPTCGRVEYSSVYRGIDLAYYGNQGRLEYDFIVAPGAHPDAIRLAVDGARHVRLGDGGELLLETGGGPVAFRKPVTYQEIAGTRHAVESRYQLAGANELRFAIGAYDPRYALVIDPSLVYSTYLGDSNVYQTGTTIAVDSQGSAYVTGTTYSMDFPLVNAEQSFFAGGSAIFVSKLAADGSSLVYSTYLGGSGFDYSRSIAVDSAGRAYIVGYTNSTDFPVNRALYPTLNGPEDAFVTEFNAFGNSLVYSTYLGGSSSDYAYGVAVDPGGNAYITGQTYSSDFPVTSGAYQTSYDGSCSFVTKMKAGGSALNWSTYFGQNCSAEAGAVAVDTQNNVYLTGTGYSGLPVTAGAPQPVFGGDADAFVAKLSHTGASLAYCTYLGGLGYDYGTAIAVDSGGNAYVAGATESTNLAVTPLAIQPAYAGDQDGFAAKLNSAGTAWQYLTYLGGSRSDQASAIAVDSSGNATVAGSSNSTDFPTAFAVQTSLSGNQVPIFKTTSVGSSWSAADTGFNADSNFYAGGLVVDPASGSHLLAVSAEGNLYGSADSGAHWAQNTSFPGELVTLAFSPAGGTVYAGYYNTMYSSSDSGATWTLAGYLPSDPFCAVLNITVDPRSATTLYIGGGSIYYGYTCSAKSADGGVTWEILSGLPATSMVTEFAIDPKSPNTIYAASYGGLYKSTDAGADWTALNVAGLVNPYVFAVALNPSQPAVVYAVANGSVYKSTNSGTSWAPASTGLTAYVNYLAVGPSSPAVLYAGSTAGMFVTANSAASWTPAGLARDLIWGIAVNPKAPGVAYAMLDVRPDGFVAKIDPAGNKLVYSTYLGGTDVEFIQGVALNSNGDAMVTGSTASPDYPATPGAFQQGTGLAQTPGYVAFVTSVGAATPACSYAVAPASYFFYPGGGAADFSVTAPSGCAWTPVSSVPWISVTSGAGPGVAPMSIGVAANTGAARTGTITMGSASISISQAAGGCTYAVSTNSLTFPQAGGSLTVVVAADTGCQWTVTGLPLWLTVTSGASGVGGGTVTLEAAPNLFPGARAVVSQEAGIPGAIDVANNSVSASQTGTLGDVPAARH